MTREKYRNGDPITLNGCDGCSPTMINGLLCHERGCPDAWRDQKRECKECGIPFHAEESRQICCSEECYIAYRGY